ncbi:hypothetical protein [Acetobacter orleanensis]|uniref:Uncharacterized protein n=1 Tax=Acetobacter orleanensis TaxID=104099 RepID=A0A4Y3TNU1_9PROT|nr:hypothetical protein [Acetobacter orleanensis]KXV65009.1 hypothetical protein AD949_05405 [Acetobacter orleanensis]PCD78910.1 hypothetical protein CO710_09915 [Acetobacter orleanensis]GAN69606.1 hypothetical protein Abol_048_020 [Acetobacter orleanensis JCM 7639]GBR29036.1 hypothetical protein AA0473_1916 [Acetobacter orleanensis NRIC 0473]GEB83488.1 hypothetical protein AOR01nite_19650 [Acetobacter orleanensis]
MESPKRWMQADGEPVSCQEKLRVLEENWQEVQGILRDAFEDAVLMGVSEHAMRAHLTDLVASLQSPHHGHKA